MENPWTPGPWRVRENHGHNAEYCDITICGDIFCLADINGPNYEHCYSNARLIAAAPEMAEALESCAAVLNGNCDDARVDVLADVNALLVRIRGGSNE